MATTWTQNPLRHLRQTKVWKSIFRRGPARTNRTRSLAVFGNLFLHVVPVKVREKSLRARATYYLGSFSFFLFVILTISGILLMLYYHPAVPQAYRDMKDLRFVVANGVFLRNLHRLAAQAMVLAVFWHMFHVFYRGGYKPPHEFNWAITVGTNIISWVPGLGHPIRFLLLGGNIVGENALLRFYVLHCVILPLAAVVLIAVHFWRIQKDGGLTVREDDERKA